MALALSQGCQNTSVTNTDEVLESLTYFRDKRTGLCFAAVSTVNGSSLSQGVALTCVPCSGKVDTLITFNENQVNQQP